METVDKGNYLTESKCHICKAIKEKDISIKQLENKIKELKKDIEHAESYILGRYI